MSFEIRDYMPKEALMQQGWADCLLWAIGHDPVIKAFKHDTGCHYTPPKTGLDAMIDEATGAQEAFVKQFIEWFNANVWGQP